MSRIYLLGNVDAATIESCVDVLVLFEVENSIDVVKCAGITIVAGGAHVPTIGMSDSQEISLIANYEAMQDPLETLRCSNVSVYAVRDLPITATAGLASPATPQNHPKPHTTTTPRPPKPNPSLAALGSQGALRQAGRVRAHRRARRHRPAAGDSAASRRPAPRRRRAADGRRDAATSRRPAAAAFARGGIQTLRQAPRSSSRLPVRGRRPRAAGPCPGP